MPWGTFAPVAVTTDDVLELRLSRDRHRTGRLRVRRGRCRRDARSPTGTPLPQLRALVLRRSAPRVATFGLTITPDPATALFLHSDGTRCNLFDTMYVSQRTLDGVAPTARLPRCTDSPQLDLENGNQWKVIGVWSMAPQP